ncbi:dTDP-4-dehydrorhamnose reductase [Psychromarinibacter sp. S121]|uniref:dTDP-4-dehydrorhamnose reductase n=1 Tax=Psychromarinibacter sp. S121 TaxID=3415127 RepID=UPI003C7DCDA8
MILVFGQSGQVARELARRASDARFVGRSEADLSRPQDLKAIIDLAEPSAVINAAAYTAVDKAEEERDLAMTINGEAPTEMAAACAARGIPFVHMSTDYVFPGDGDAPTPPDAATGPINAYGQSKLAGELGIRAVNGPHVILRTSWVVSSHGANFVKSMLRLSETRDKLTIVADQIGGPTPAGPLAAACLAAVDALKADPSVSGTYHFAGAPDVSWADFAREIFRQAGRDVVVEDIPTSAYPTPAKRPHNSRLDCSSLSRLGVERPDWKAELTDILKELENA